jgi:hypothetical protein
MVVNLNKLKTVLDYLDEINKAELEDIEWIIDGEEIAPDYNDVERWKLIGLNNCEFARAHLPLRDSE